MKEIDSLTPGQKVPVALTWPDNDDDVDSQDLGTLEFIKAEDGKLHFKNEDNKEIRLESSQFDFLCEEPEDSDEPEKFYFQASGPIEIA